MLGWKLGVIVPETEERIGFCVSPSSEWGTTMAIPGPSNQWSTQVGVGIVSRDEKVLLPDDVTYQRIRILWPLLFWTGVLLLSTSSRKQKTKLTFFNDQSHHFIYSTQDSLNNYVFVPTIWWKRHSPCPKVKRKDSIKGKNSKFHSCSLPPFFMDYKREEWYFSRDEALETNVYL